MKDRFKFRLYSKQDGKYGTHEEALSMMMLGNRQDNGSAENNDYLEYFDIEQCTGFTGKNGDLIFEGDIILVKGFQCEVVWNEHFLCFAPLEVFKRNGLGRQFQSRLCDLYKYEITGNIHDA